LRKPATNYTVCTVGQSAEVIIRLSFVCSSMLICKESLSAKVRSASSQVSSLKVLKVAIAIIVLHIIRRNYKLLKYAEVDRLVAKNGTGTAIAQDFSTGGKSDHQPNYRPAGMSSDLQGLNRTVQHGIIASGLELDLILDGVDNNSSKTGIAPAINMRVFEMMEKGLNLSAKHQSRFNDRKQLLAREFPTTMLYPAKTYTWAAVVLNDEFAYL
jgi:hypothetical protein